MRFDVTVLGCNAAIPAYGRNTAAYLLSTDSRHYLIDCGEGVQIQLQKYQIRHSKIHQIFISHLHGDHFLGLFGLLCTMSMMGREEPLTLFAPKGLQTCLDTVLQSMTAWLDFECKIVETQPTKHYLLFEDEFLEVFTIPLHHGVPCCGFLFREKQKLPNISKEAVLKYAIPYTMIQSIKNGGDFITETGAIIPHSELCISAPQPKSFAYCSDTGYYESIIPIIKEVNLLMHETTFGEDMEVHANMVLHSTSRQAALIAQKANVKALLMGHFSSRYKELTPLLTEAKTIFENSILAEEGQIYPIL